MTEIQKKYEEIVKDIDFMSTDADSHGKTIIQVGSATCEKAAGSDDVRAEFEKLIRASNRDDIMVKQTGCTGRCAQEPIVGVFVPGQMAVKYRQVNVEQVT
jgi:NADH:ubiquinone oxidoreductase subunit E